MTPLKEKYNKYSMVVYKVTTHAPRKGRVMVCSLCGKEYKDRIDKGVKEIICPYCLMGMADAMETNKANYINLEELLDYVKDGKLAKFRSTNGLTRGDLGRYIGISSKYLQRIENLANYPVDRIVKAIKKKIATVHSV